DNIGYELYKMINQDIKTNYNILSLTDKYDELAFIPNSQFQRYKENNVDISTKHKSKAKVGRIVRQLLKDNNKSYPDSSIEQFVNRFKSKWDKLHGINTRKIKIVSGKD